MPLAFSLAFAVTPCHRNVAAEAAAEIDPKIRKELAEVEDRLGHAIEQRDIKTLSDLLADYYADSYQGSTKAFTKSTALARVKAGTLFSCRIEKDLRISSSVDTYTVEGQARVKPSTISDQESEIEWTGVRRLWVKKDGRWLLVAQVLGQPDGDKVKNERTK